MVNCVSRCWSINPTDIDPGNCPFFGNLPIPSRIYVSCRDGHLKLWERIKHLALLALNSLRNLFTQLNPSTIAVSIPVFHLVTSCFRQMYHISPTQIKFMSGMIALKKKTAAKNTIQRENWVPRRISSCSSTRWWFQPA